MQHVPIDLTGFRRGEAGRIDADSTLRVVILGGAGESKSMLVERLLRETRRLIPDSGGAHGTISGNIPTGPLGHVRHPVNLLGTEDIACQVLATGKKTILVSDTSGHEEDTRYLASAASISDVGVVLVDALDGVQTQVRRHIRIAALFGIRNLVLAVNRCDLAGWSENSFRRLAEAYRVFVEPLRLASFVAIPISTRNGDNIVERSSQAAWYAGPTLLEYLEGLEASAGTRQRPFRMPIQSVSPSTSGAGSVSGTIATGIVRLGERVVVARTGREAHVRGVHGRDGALQQQGAAGEAVELALDGEIDAAPGDLLVAAGDRPEIADQFAAHVVWMHDEPLIPGRPYLLKIGASTVTASITEIKHREDVDAHQRLAAKTLQRDEIGFVNVATQEPVAFDRYDENRETGSFLLFDRLSRHTVGAGIIRFGLWRATNVHWQALDVTKESRAALKGQKPCCLWFTGLSGSGKSTIANALEKKLHAHGRHTFILDGDNTRHGLNRDLGFTDADRVENIRRAAHVAKLMVDAGLIVLVSFISPFEAERRMARELFETGEFFEIFVDTPLEICEQRDVKGLYKKARSGEIQNFTGISSRYEPPVSPDLHLEAGVLPPDVLADRIFDHLRLQGIF